MDEILKDIIKKYQYIHNDMEVSENKTIPIWCCWWQGEKTMPELVKRCQIRLRQVVPFERADMHLITLENYKEYVDIPRHIMQKFEDGFITMTAMSAMSDVLRFQLLEKYGGYWIDVTAYVSCNIPLWT